MSLIKIKPRGTDNVTGRKNLVINGAMQVAQRGTSSANSGYHTVDRFTNTFGTAAFTQTVDTTVPTGEGFSSSYKHECTTASSATGAFFGIQHSIEAQNIRNSGWDYTSASSFVTLSFYARSSVAGTYLCGLRTTDGTAYNISSQYTLAANTWKRVIVSFPGNSNLTFNNDTGIGLKVFPMLELGSDYTAGSTFDAWAAHGASTQTPDVAINIHDTVNSTFFVTGVQLETGNSASDFEHRSFAEEQAACQRYFYRVGETGGVGHAVGSNFATGAYYNASDYRAFIDFPVTMRANPTLTSSTVTNAFRIIRANGSDYPDSIADAGGSAFHGKHLFTNDDLGSATAGDAGVLIAGGTSAAFLNFDAEI